MHNPFMKIRDLRYLRFNSSIARWTLQWVYAPDIPHRVRFGPLRGLQLHYDRSINFHAILGLWDTEIFAVLKKIFVHNGLLPKDSTIADVGSNIGYYTLWFSRLALNGGKICAFEPDPRILPILSRNLQLNNIENVEVVAAACGAHDGTIDF